MKKFPYLILSGFLVWLIPFVVSLVMFPHKQAGSPLFETVMAVTVALAGIIFTVSYLRKIRWGFLKEGFVVGVVFMLMSIGIDMILFTWGPMKMTFVNYMVDIGITYAIYPVISVGMGYILEKK